MDTKTTYKSNFISEEVYVSIIYPEDQNYFLLVPFFKKYGFGFLAPESNLIVIDGSIVSEFGDSIIQVIESHEVAHIKLGHNKETSSEEELDADLGAYLILKSFGLEESISLLLQNFELRHGIQFKEEMTEKLKNHFS